MIPLNAIGYAIVIGLTVLIPTLCHYAANMWTPEYEPFQAHARGKEYLEKQERLTEQFSQHLFYVGSGVGIASLVLGSYLPVQALSSGFIFGGTFSIMQGVVFNWRKLQPVLKFLVLLTTIVILTFIGYTKLAH